MNVFLVGAPLRGWRQVRVRDCHTRRDWAGCITEVVDVHDPDAERSKHPVLAARHCRPLLPPGEFVEEAASPGSSFHVLQAGSHVRGAQPFCGKLRV